MSTRIDLDFDLKQKVIVTEIQRPGRIDMIQIDNLGITYRVALWDNGKRETVWLYADEIQAR